MAKMSRKELLNAPDELITTTGTIVTWIKSNPVRFATITVIIAVALLSGTGLYYWTLNREFTSMLEYNKSTGNAELALTISQNYTGTKAGKLARLRLAKIAYTKKDFDNAIGNADDFINSWGHEDIFYWESLLLLSMAYMGKNDTERALPLMDNCIDEAPEAIKDQALFHKANILSDMGKYSDAKKALEGISTKYSDLASITMYNLNKHPGDSSHAE